MTGSVGTLNVEVYIYKRVKNNNNYVKVSTQPTLYNLKKIKYIYLQD